MSIALDQAALQLNLEMARDKRNDDLVRGLANTRVHQLLITGEALDPSVPEVAAMAGQSHRSFARRMQLARELSRPGMEDLVQLVRDRELGITHALELVKLRVAGHDASPADLRAMRFERPRKLGPIEVARLEGFVEGVRWCHRALLSEQPHPDWLSQLAVDWQRTRSSR